MVDITEVRIYRVLGSDKLRAFANVTLGGEYAVHGVRVMEREDGTLWIGMPRQRSGSDGVWRDVFHPVTSESRERLIEEVLRAYNEFVEKDMGGKTEAEESKVEVEEEAVGF